MARSNPILHFLGCAVFSFIFLTVPARADQNGIRYDLDLVFNSRANTISGVEIIGFRNNSQTSIDTIFLDVKANAFRTRQARAYQKYEDQFEAPSGISISSLTVGNRSPEVINYHSVNPAIILPEPLIPGDSIIIALRFITKIPEGRSSLCPTHTKSLYRLINFYPKIAEYHHNGWQVGRLNDLERPSLEYAHYTLRLTLPSRFFPAGSLQTDSVLTLNDNRSCYLFKPEYLQDIAFILGVNFRISSLQSKTNGEIRVVNSHSGGDRIKDQIATKIAQDIVDFYLAMNSDFSLRLTIFPTIISAGYSAPNFIMIDKSIFSGVTRLDYFSIYVLAQEIARQYLGADLNTTDTQYISISNGLAAAIAEDFLQSRYRSLHKTLHLPESRLATLTEKLMGIFTSALERENLMQQSGAINDRDNTIYTSSQSRYLKSRKMVEMTRYALGDSLFNQVMAQYRAYLNFNIPDPAQFFRIAEDKSGFLFSEFYQNSLNSEQPTDFKIQKVKRTRLSPTEHATTVVVKQKLPLYLPLETQVIDRLGNVINQKHLLDAGSYDTLQFITRQPIYKISLDPNRRIWDSNRFNNQYPRSVVFKFLIGLPSIDTYQIFYYPTFDFNRTDILRFGVKLRGRYWINMQPLFPAQSLDEWSLGINYGYGSKTLGYDLSYSTALLAFIFEPRIYLRLRDYFDLLQTKLSTEVYLGDVRYWGLSRVQGYQKLSLGIDYQKVRSLQFLNEANWESGQTLKPFLDYVNFHNWGDIRHILRLQFAYGLPVDDRHFSFDKLTVDTQVKTRLSRRYWLYQRLFFGNAHGNLPKQEYFYFFGQNVLENQSFESYRLAKGAGDMRGYGDQSLKGYKILTANTELRRNLAGLGAALFDFLLFLDSGILPESFEEIDWQKTFFDAGLGLELEVLEAVKLGMHFPLWVSQPPKSAKELALRWVIAFDFIL